jgi:hypothetical protein
MEDSSLKHRSNNNNQAKNIVHLPVWTIEGGPSLNSNDFAANEKEILKRRIRASIVGFLTFLLTFAEKYLPEVLTKRDPYDESGFPIWVVNFNRWIERNRKKIKICLYCISAIPIYYFVILPSLWAIIEQSSSSEYFSEVRILPPSRVESYMDALNIFFESWKYKQGVYDNKDSDQSDDNFGGSYEYHSLYGAKKMQTEATNSLTDEDYFNMMMEQYSKKNICTKVIVSRTSKMVEEVLCFDALKFILDVAFAPKNTRTKEMTCICSDYMGVATEFVYMIYPGEESILIIDPVIQPDNRDAKLFSKRVVYQQGNDLDLVDQKFRQILKFPADIMQPDSILVEYYTLPSNETIEKYYPNTADIKSFIRNLSIRERVGYSGNIIADTILWIAQYADLLYERMTSKGYDKYKKEITKLIQMRISRKGLMDGKDTDRKQDNNEFNIMDYFRSDKKSDKQLIREKGAIKLPYSSCILHCKRFHQNLLQK